MGEKANWSNDIREEDQVGDFTMLGCMKDWGGWISSRFQALQYILLVMGVCVKKASVSESFPAWCIWVLFCLIWSRH